jgi:DNA-binding MarR family transcriptional regulator/GNAT superfamily N-acetyltransferase
MSDERIAQVRRFNRTVAQRTGTLGDRFLALNRPYGEARLLWEIGTEGCEVRTLRRRLELDSGQTSRLLRSLEADCVVEVAPSPADGRIRIARLTKAGLAERALLDRRSDELAESILAPLDDEQSTRLLDAMRTVERLITLAAVEFRQVDPTHPDARQCLRAYVDELNSRSDMHFDPKVGSTAEPHEVTPPRGAFLVVYLHGEPVACGAVKHFPGGKSDIKRMWVSPSVRGLGVGRRLLAELEAIVANSGASVARIETNRTLVEAIKLYKSVGYREVPPFNDEPFAHHWFEKRVDSGTRRSS